MRILAFTDIHGSFAVVERILHAEAPAEVVLLGGDLTTLGSAVDVERIVRLVRRRCTSVFAIGGNMDPIALEETFERLGVSINGSGVLIGEVGFFGVSGAPLSPLHTPHEIPEAELLAVAQAGWNSIAGTRVTVFVAHAPPFDTSVDVLTSGGHAGSRAVRTVIQDRQPDLVVCGHIHEAHGVTTLGRTKIVNCGSAAQGRYAVIEVGDSINVEARRHTG